MKTAVCFLAALGLSSAFVVPAPRMGRGRSVRMVRSQCWRKEGAWGTWG